MEPNEPYVVQPQQDGVADHAPKSSKVPTDKVTAATIGAAASQIVVYLIETLSATDLPTVIEGAIAVIFVFLAGYIKTETHPAG